jgi:hypothetical protein
MDRIGYPWVTGHAFRKTVASRLDNEGFSIRHIADQPGHTRPSTTLDFYLGRRTVTTTDFADALQPLAHSAGESTVRYRLVQVRGRSPWPKPLAGVGPWGSNPQPAVKGRRITAHCGLYLRLCPQPRAPPAAPADHGQRHFMPRTMPRRLGPVRLVTAGRLRPSRQARSVEREASSTEWVSARQRSRCPRSPGQR